MAEHSRSSGVFSRRRVAVNGFAAVRPPALVVTLCRALSGERRLTPCDGGRPLCRATVGGPLSRPPNPHIGVCKSGALQKNWRQPRPVTRPRMQRKRRPRFLPALSLPAKTCRCKSGQGPGCISRIFFFAQPSALFVAAPTTTTTTTAGPLSPPFLQPSKMAVSAIYFFLSS